MSETGLKMMGKDPDNLARGVAVDRYGNVSTQLKESVVELKRVDESVGAGSSFTIDVEDTGAYQSLVVNVRSAEPDVNYSLRVMNYTKDNRFVSHHLFNESDRLIERSTGVVNEGVVGESISFNTSAPRVKIRITNLESSEKELSVTVVGKSFPAEPTGSMSRQVAMDNTLKEMEKIAKKSIVELRRVNQNVEPGQRITVDLEDVEPYQSLALHVRSDVPDVKYTLRVMNYTKDNRFVSHYLFDGDNRQLEKSTGVINLGVIGEPTVFNVEASRVRILVDNNDPLARDLDLVVFGRRFPIDKSTASEKTTTQINSQQANVYPKEPLEIKIPEGFTTDLYVRSASLGMNGEIITIRENQPIRRMSDIQNVSEYTEGIIWDESSYGTPRHMAVFPSGICVTSQHDDGVAIYHLDDIHSTPVSVYRREEEGILFASHFGFDYYRTFNTEMVLVSEYGHNDKPKNLMLSIDGGKTFNVIKKTPDKKDGVNSHFHDVEIDKYTGDLWAAQGDYGNSAIFMSSNLGETWKEIHVDIRRQPTQILSFPDRVIFGRDSTDLEPGGDYLMKPTKSDDWNNVEVKELYTSMPGARASIYYASGGKNRGSEGYWYQPTALGDNEKGILYGTGDGGNTMTPVYLSFSSGSAAYPELRVFAIDKKYIYMVSPSPLGGYPLLYAEKPEWLKYN